MTTLEILIAARALIEKPENWCKRYPARTLNGVCVMPRDYYAAKWTAAGALLAVANIEGAWRAMTLLTEVAGTPQPSERLLKYVNGFNDDPRTTHAQVLALFDRAIAFCGEAA